MPTIHTTTCVPDVDGDWRIELTCDYTPGWLGRLFGFRPHRRTTTYVGECTVWHRLPTFERPGTIMEGELSEIWSREQYLRKGGEG